jgi:hypothetical protein
MAAGAFIGALAAASNLLGWDEEHFCAIWGGWMNRVSEAECSVAVRAT